MDCRVSRYGRGMAGLDVWHVRGCRCLHGCEQKANGVLGKRTWDLLACRVTIERGNVASSFKKGTVQRDEAEGRGQNAGRGRKKFRH